LSSTNSYPLGLIRALLETSLVTPQTRAVLIERLQGQEQQAWQVFEPELVTTLQIVVARLVSPALDLAEAVDRRLASGQGDGWRYNTMPPDLEAHQSGLRGIEESARLMFGQSLAELAVTEQDAVLEAVRTGQAPGKVWQQLPAQRYFTDLLTELCENYYSHPLTQEKIGYVGMADGRGWQKLGLDQKEDWEPEEGATDYTVPDDEPGATYQVPHPMPPTALAEVDVVVIGTGAGGAPLLARLAQAGFSVVALEAGEHWQPDRDFATDERAQTKLFWNDERLSAGQDPVAFGSNNSGTGVGGSTLHYTAYVPRPQPDDFTLHQDSGAGVDWPLSYWDLEPYYDEVERILGVSGPSPYPWGPERTPYPLAPLPLNGAAQLMARGCRALGLRTAPAANAALSAPYFQAGIGWRRACTNRGFCQAGCTTGGKASMDVTFIPLAIAHGAEVRSGCFVTQIETDPQGRVTAVIYQRGDQEERQPCRALFLCAGAIETPRLLLLNGLGNQSGQVGRNFMAHPGMQVWGQFPESVRPYKGIPGGLISEDTHRPTDADFVGGYLLQSIGVMPVTYASQVARGSGLWGEALHSHMQGYNHTAGINILGECLPYDHNYLELATELDGRGLPKPRIHFTNGENEQRMNAHAENLMQAIWREAGAETTWTFARNAHIIGTCRMGLDPTQAVVNPEGRVFEVPNLYILDNSVFPSALSVNPALTIMALALRTADCFIARTRRGEV